MGGWGVGEGSAPHYPPKETSLFSSELGLPEKPDFSHHLHHSLCAAHLRNVNIGTIRTAKKGCVSFLPVGMGDPGLLSSAAEDRGNILL